VPLPQLLVRVLSGFIFEFTQHFIKNFSTEDAFDQRNVEKGPTTDVKSWNTFIKDALKKLGITRVKSLSILIDFKILITPRIPRSTKEASKSVHAFFDYSLET
jgi:hypothetical protein